MNNYVWKHFPGGEDWGLFPRGTKELEEDNAVVILSRMNSSFPWSVYINGKRNDRAIDGCETDKLNDIKDYILRNLNDILGKDNNESLEEDMKKELPTTYSIDLATYYMDDYDSGVELDDWINAYLKDEFGKEPYSYECEIDEDDYSSSADLSNIVWEKPKAESLEETIEEDANKKSYTYEICYTDADGNKVCGQYGDASWVGTHLKNLENWGATDIVVKIHDESKTEEKLTEAPDDDGILSDDELDAEEQKERDEFEARMKARRDQVAQQRADRDAKIAKQNELKAQAEAKVKEIGDDWSFEHLFDTLVPNNGKCDTLAGELLRAINRIEYRWFNDGDRFNEDYGIETCGQPAYFLAHYIYEEEDEAPFWNILLNVDTDGNDEKYDEMIEELKNKAVEFLKAHQELLATETSDMYDVNSRDVEKWLEEENLIPKYDVDCSIPPELDAHLEKSNISERDLIWEVESWLENIGGARYSDVNVDWGNVYVNDCNKQVYDELDGGRTLYKWLEDYAEELNSEYGDPNESDEDEESEEEEEEDGE